MEATKVTINPVVAHGYTVAGVDTLARNAARPSRWTCPRFAERRDLAWFAIIEHLLTTAATLTAVVQAVDAGRGEPSRGSDAMTVDQNPPATAPSGCPPARPSPGVQPAPPDRTPDTPAVLVASGGVPLPKPPVLRRHTPTTLGPQGCAS